jgi:hypothetical protein
MPKKRISKKDTATQMNSFPNIVCRVPWAVTKVIPLADYRLDVTFNDGTQGCVEMKSFVMDENAGVFCALRDVAFFNQVSIVMGVVTWPDEIDLAPDVMHEEIKKRGIYSPR